MTRFVGYKRRAACACRWIARIVAYKSRATPRVRGGAHALREVLDASPDAAATSGQTTTEIPAQGQEGRIIGKGGENIRALSTQTGRRLQSSKRRAWCAMSSDADKVEAAVAVVEDFIDKQINPVRVTNAACPWMNARRNRTAATTAAAAD